MADILREICIYLSQNIQIDDLKPNQLNELKTMSERIMKTEDLPKEVNFFHIVEKHQRKYELKCCGMVHCFECLAKRVENLAEVCEHGKEVTKYEARHLKFLKDNLRK
jgi:hypothetical protein